MKLRAAVAIAVVVVAGGAAWQTHLFRVDRSTAVARPLAALPASDQRRAAFDVVLTAVPSGMQRLQSGPRATLIRYWAPWERHGRAQALALDSLARDSSLAGLHVAIVCFDPFPSVARFVGRHRMTTTVLLDHEGTLRRQLACPVMPYTYVVDATGRIRVAQPGEVDWTSEETRRVLRAALENPAASPPVALASRFGTTGPLIY